MPDYSYNARSMTGKVKKGVASAADGRELAALLRQQGLFLVSHRESRRQHGGYRLTGKELSDFNRELGTMLQSGITLLRAFEIMLNRDVPAKRRAAFGKIYTALLSGTAMSDAMGQQGRLFPPLLISMFRAGEANGTLAAVAMRMAEHYEKEHRLQLKAKTAATYPAILLAVTFVVVTAVFNFILPQFINLYAGSQLPGITRAVIAVSRLFTVQLHWLIIGVAVIVGLCGWLMSHASVKRGLDKLKLRLPVTGKLQKIITTARFARTLSSLYASGVSILTALDAARETVGNAYISHQFDGLAADIQSGLPLSRALERIDGFDKKLAATVSVGEESGRLEPMLLSVADSFEYEAAEAAQRLVAVIEPVCIVGMAVIIGIIMVAMMLPILGMYDSIENGAYSPIMGIVMRRTAL